MVKRKNWSEDRNGSYIIPYLEGGKKQPNLIPNKTEKGLITLNQTTIRKKAITECQKTLKKIDKVKEELDQFEKKDKPAYERWIKENFGELINKIRIWSIEIQY